MFPRTFSIEQTEALLTEGAKTAKLGEIVKSNILSHDNKVIGDASAGVFVQVEGVWVQLALTTLLDDDRRGWWLMGWEKELASELPGFMIDAIASNRYGSVLDDGILYVIWAFTKS